MAGEMLMISCRRAAIVPKECQSMLARSGTTSLFLLSSRRAASLLSGEASSTIQAYTFSLSTEVLRLPCPTPPPPAEETVGGVAVLTAGEGAGASCPEVGEVLGPDISSSRSHTQAPLRDISRVWNSLVEVN